MTTQNVSDERIAAEVVKGNRDRYSELVKRYETRLLRYTTYLLQDTGAAHDVVQDTFIKGYQNLSSFNPDLKFSSWIYRIAHNESVNRLKRSKRDMFNVDFDFIKELVPQEGLSPDQEFERGEVIDQLKKSMDLLPVKFREVLTLFYLENKSYEEISSIMEVSVGTVGTWINRVKPGSKKY